MAIDRIRVFMLRTHEDLIQGFYYNLMPWQANILLETGYARLAHQLPVGPSRTKPFGPSEVKLEKKKRDA